MCGHVQLFLITNDHALDVRKASHLQSAVRTLINPHSSLRGMQAGGSWRHAPINYQYLDLASKEPSSHGAVNTFPATSSESGTRTWFVMGGEGGEAVPEKPRGWAEGSNPLAPLSRDRGL